MVERKNVKTRSWKLTLLSIVVWILIQAITDDFASGQVLTHGPVVGGVTDSEAKVFVRTNEASTVAVWYGTVPNLVTFQTSETLHTNPPKNFTKIIPLTNLSPETTYYMNVVVNGLPQLSPPYPSFKTFPPTGSSRSFNFVVLTDFKTVKNITSSVQTFASAAATSPAFAFIGGDFDHRNPIDLYLKRKMYRDLYDANTPFMGDFVNLILRKTPIIHQWDDHDAGVNNIDKTYPNWDLNQKVFEEYVPSYRLPSVTPGIWQKFSYAQIDCFVLDCRSQRDPETDPDNNHKSMLDGNNLGPGGQLQWLENGLLTSTARWKIIFTSVVTNPTTKFLDGWGGYQTEWEALKNFINTNNIRRVVFISGDLHLGAIDNGSRSGFPEMCVASANSSKVGRRCCTGGERGIWSEGYYDDTCPGFGLVSILQSPPRLILQVADEYGNIHISYTVSD